MTDVQLNEMVFDVRGFESAISRVNVNSSLISEVVNFEVQKYTKDLDDTVSEVRQLLSENAQIPDYALDVYIARIPTLLYYAAPAKEAAGIQEDTAKMIRQKLYIEARLQASGTVADKDNAAALVVEQETLTSIAYGRISKTIQAKTEMALELLSALKKICSKRIEESQLSMRDSS